MRKVSEIIEVDGMGQDLTATVLEDIHNYMGDFMTDIIILVDESTSIRYYGLDGVMAEGIKNIKDDLLGSKNADSIRVCVMRFGSDVPKKLDFVPLEKMDTSYSSHQRQTHLYEAICVANNLLVKHIEAMSKKNVYVNGLLIVATDGEDIGSKNYYDTAVDVVKQFNGPEMAIDIQYICVGSEAIKCAKGLGLKPEQILAVEDTADQKKVRHQWAMASESAKSASLRAAGSSNVTTSAAAKWNIDD